MTEKTLDVRPILQSGQDPFAVIMQALDSVPDGGTLKLIAPFRPYPILQLLGSKGWAHKIENGEGGNWIIWLFRAEEKAVPEVSNSLVEATYLQKEHPELRERLQVKIDHWILDVRGMKMPGPMELTLQVLDKLPENVSLVQINERVPEFLFPVLSLRGYSCESQTSGDGVRTIIRKK